MYDWCWAVTQTSDVMLRVVDAVLISHAGCARQLCDIKDEHRRRAIDIAAIGMKTLLRNMHVLWDALISYLTRSFTAPPLAE
jgi:hypothetical protein